MDIWAIIHDIVTNTNIYLNSSSLLKNDGNNLNNSSVALLIFFAEAISSILFIDLAELSYVRKISDF